MIVLLALVACRTHDPVLVAERRAQDAWQQGVDALKAGDAHSARADFTLALTFEPDDPLLLSWQAQAAAADGDLPGAVAILDRVLGLKPDFPEARYNRAAYLAREGDVPHAAAELSLAFQSGVKRSPRDAREDPDFAPHLNDPAFAGVLPAEPLTVALDAPDGSVFLGGDYTVRLRVAGAGDETVTVTADAASGPVELVSALEDVHNSTDGPMRELSWTFRVDGAGTAALGPFHVRAGSRVGEAPALTVVCETPPGKEDSPTPIPPFRLATPRELAGGRTAPAQWTSADGALLLVGPDGHLTTTPPDLLAHAVKYEERDLGTPKWRLWEVTSGGHVTVTEHGNVVLDRTWGATGSGG